MSRRRGEFEHRTSIFEGAYRAWSHLGGCNPHDLMTVTAADLDPLENPHDIEKDPRILAMDPLAPVEVKNLTGDPKCKKQTRVSFCSPYEPLPRNGLAHPFIQAIIAPWLGPDADLKDVHHGLTTLRTWWQHRRKGESVSALSALRTEKMDGVVKGYTRHFFNLAHCMVVNDNEHPPRSLWERLNLKASSHNNVLRKGLNQSARKKDDIKINFQRACIDLINNYNGQDAKKKDIRKKPAICVQRENDPTFNDDPGTIPAVYVSDDNGIQILIQVESMNSCDHCARVVETVLKGLHGTKSPIPGIIDAIASNCVPVVLVKISDISSAKRISHEIGEILLMIGYTVYVKQIDIKEVLSEMKSKHANNNKQDEDYDEKKIADMLMKAYKNIALSFSSPELIDWARACECRDERVIAGSQCKRHSGIDQEVLDMFDSRAKQVIEMVINKGWGVTAFRPPVIAAQPMVTAIEAPVTAVQPPVTNIEHPVTAVQPPLPKKSDAEAEWSTKKQERKPSKTNKITSPSSEPKESNSAAASQHEESSSKRSPVLKDPPTKKPKKNEQNDTQIDDNYMPYVPYWHGPHGHPHRYYQGNPYFNPGMPPHGMLPPGMPPSGMPGMSPSGMPGMSPSGMPGMSPSGIPGNYQQQNMMQHYPQIIMNSNYQNRQQYKMFNSPDNKREDDNDNDEDDGKSKIDC